MFFRNQGCFLCAIWHLTIPNTFLEFFCSNCWNFSVPILSLVRSPSRRLSCLRGLFCPCWQRDFLACLLQTLLLASGLLACLTSGSDAFSRFHMISLCEHGTLRRPLFCVHHCPALGWCLYCILSLGVDLWHESAVALYLSTLPSQFSTRGGETGILGSCPASHDFIL